MFNPNRLKKWFKKAGLKQEGVAFDFGFKTHSSITQKLNGITPWTGEELGKLFEMMKKTLSLKDMGECFKEIFEIDFVATQQTKEVVSSDLVDALKDLAQARKELNEQKDRTHVLEKAIYTYEHRLMCDHRSSDPPELNPTKMRRAIKFDSDHEIHP